MRQTTLAACCLTIAAQSAMAQCDPQWDTQFGKTVGVIKKMVEFDDGTGPALYAIGEWNSIGGSLTTGVAKLVDGRWEKVGLGLQSGYWIASDVRDMVVYDADGSGPGQPLLVVAGAISYLDEFFTPNPTGVMAWNGSSWTTLGAPTDVLSDLGTSLAVIDSPSGQTLYFGGFNNGNLFGQFGVMQWDGFAWSVVGSNFSPLGFGDFVYSLAVHDDGTGPALFAAGGFGNMDGAPRTNNVAKWTGSQWTGLGAGTSSLPAITKLATFDPDGSGATPGVLAVIDATTVKTWNGTTLSAGVSLPDACFSALISATYNDTQTGTLLIGSNNLPCDGTSTTVLAFDGSTVTPAFEPISGGWVTYIGRHDLGRGEELIVAGSFTGTLSSPDTVLAWNGTAYEAPFSSGGATGSVRSLLSFDPDGPGGIAERLYAAGVGAVGAPQVSVPVLASFDGATWSSETAFPALGFDGVGFVTRGSFAGSPVMFASGEILGSFSRTGVGVFDGVQWSRIGNPDDFRFVSPFRGAIIRSIVTPDLAGSAGEELFVTGRFNQAGGVEARGIARWNGTAWEALPSPPGIVSSAGFDFDVSAYLATDGADDRLVAVYNNGATTWTAAAWDGSTWTPLGLPSLNVFRLGDDLLSINDSGVFRLEGAAWIPVGPAAPTPLFTLSRALGSVDFGDGRGERAYFTYAPATSFVGTSELLTFDGTSWSQEPVGAFTGTVAAVARFDTAGEPSLWFGGTFAGVGAELDPADPYQAHKAISSNSLARLYTCPTSTCPPCAADFDGNGGVDGGDLAAFFADFETGATCADVDGNGGVDGGDLAAFFNVFEAGGC